MRLVRRLVPTTDEYDGQKLFTMENGKRVATPLFAVLVLIEATDVVFAVDSVPAILAVSREPFIVFASNAFAILGLRSLYFLLGGMQGKFRYLNIGLGVILAFVGVKMLADRRAVRGPHADVRLARRSSSACWPSRSSPRCRPTSATASAGITSRTDASATGVHGGPGRRSSS